MTWDELAGAIQGSVVGAGDGGFDDAVRGHNTALRHQPDAVVRAADEDDVAAAVRFARQRQLPVQAQSTGHGPPRVTRGGLLLLTRALDRIEVDPERRGGRGGAGGGGGGPGGGRAPPERRVARVGAGAVWGDLVAACAAYELAPLGMASVASVGVAGYLLGGGMGPLGRREGFGADHVVAIDVVDADGQARTVDADRDA